MLTVACVYWSGEFRGREKIYSTEWITKLQNMVSRNLTVPHRFVCLSNVEVPCERIPLIHDWKGFWSKVELFRPGLFEDRVLYLDLDLVITSALIPFVEYPSDFAILAAQKPYRYQKEGKRYVPMYNSSVMVFNAGDNDSLYTDFSEPYMETLWGDQDYIALRLPKLDTFPKGWIEKIKNLPGNTPALDTKIVLCMPGYTSQKNTTMAEKYEWVRKIWK